MFASPPARGASSNIQGSREFARLQRQFVLAAGDAMRKTIELEIPDAVGSLLGRTAMAAATAPRPAPAVRRTEYGFGR